MGVHQPRKKCVPSNLPVQLCGLHARGADDLETASGQDGRAGMAALILAEGSARLDLTATQRKELFNHLSEQLPRYVCVAEILRSSGQVSRGQSQATSSDHVCVPPDVRVVSPSKQQPHDPFAAVSFKMIPSSKVEACLAEARALDVVLPLLGIFLV